VNWWGVLYPGGNAEEHRRGSSTPTRVKVRSGRGHGRRFADLGVETRRAPGRVLRLHQGRTDKYAKLIKANIE
jgi:hypothetical protein